MPNLETAIRIAAAAHSGQLDKEGQPYILHPLRLMASLSDESAKMVAVLHDVVEDTATTLDDLRKEGFDESVLQAVACMTHSKEDSYADYVVRCKANPIAKQVKLADLNDNARLDRTILRPDRIDRDLARIHRYMLSYKYLTDQLSEAEYRSLMDRFGNVDAHP